MPCGFARTIARDRHRGAGGIAWAVLDDIDHETPLLARDAMIAAGRLREATAIVFPRITAAEGVVELLASLHGLGDWLVSLPVPKGRTMHSDVCAVGLTWKTAHGDACSVMGLGPIGTMPEHRRAPYVALVGWTGEHENDLEKRRAGHASLLGMPHSHKPAAYARLRKQTREESDAFREAPFGAGAHHDVAFTLPAALRPRLEQIVSG